MVAFSVRVQRALLELLFGGGVQALVERFHGRVDARHHLVHVLPHVGLARFPPCLQVGEHVGGVLPFAHVEQVIVVIFHRPGVEIPVTRTGQAFDALHAVEVHQPAAVLAHDARQRQIGLVHQAFPVFGDIPVLHVVLLSERLFDHERVSWVNSAVDPQYLGHDRLAFTADDERADTGLDAMLGKPSRTVAHHRRPEQRIPVGERHRVARPGENPFDGHA